MDVQSFQGISVWFYILYKASVIHTVNALKLLKIYKFLPKFCFYVLVLQNADLDLNCL